MRSVLLSRFGPAIGKERLKLAGLHGVDSSQDVGEVFDRVDVVGLARSHEREMDRGCAAAGIGANEETVLAHQDEVFDCLLSNIVVDFEVRILEEPGQSDPVIEGVINSCHQGICGIESGFEGDYFRAKLFDQWLRASTSNGQSLRWRLPAYVSFYVVEFFVYIQDDVSEFWLDGQAIVVSSARVGMTANLSARLHLEESIEAAGGIRLNAGGNILEPSSIALEGLIRRKIEDGEFEFFSDVDSHFAFAHSSFELAVLDLYFRIIGVDDFGFACFASHQFVERLEGERSLKRAVALGRAWNDRVFAFESFLLAVMWQTVAESAGDDVGAERCSVLTPGMVGLIGCDDVDFALLARPYFLLVLKVSERMQELVELVAQLVADEGCRDLALRTDRILFGDEVIDGLGGKIVIADMFPRAISIRRWRFDCGGGRSFSWCALRVVAFSLRTEVLAIALFELYYEDIELSLKILELFPEFFLSGKSFAQLLTEFRAATIGFLELSFERLKEFFLLGVFQSEAIDF